MRFSDAYVDTIADANATLTLAAMLKTDAATRYYYWIWMLLLEYAAGRWYRILLLEVRLVRFVTFWRRLLIVTPDVVSDRMLSRNADPGCCQWIYIWVRILDADALLLPGI